MSDAVLIAAITSGTGLAALAMVLIAKPQWRRIKFGPLDIWFTDPDHRP
jgi:hypothetical protein